MIDLNAVRNSVVVGLCVGLVVGGVGVRLAMRGVALIVGASPSFTAEGTVGILLMGAVLGALLSLPFLLVRRVLRLPAPYSGTLYGLLLWVIFLFPLFLEPEGEFTLISPLMGLLLFAPIPLLYGLCLAVGLNWLQRYTQAIAARPVGLAWVICFGLMLLFALTSMASLIGEFAAFPPAFARLSRDLGLMETLRSAHLLFVLTFALVYCGLACFIFWHGSNHWLPKFAALALLCFAGAFFHTGRFFADLMPALPLLSLVPGFVQALSVGSLLCLLYLFPDGHFRPAWTRSLVFLWGGAGLLLGGAVWLAGAPVTPTNWPDAFLSLCVAASLMTGVVAQLVRYRTTLSPAERRQNRWVLIGTAGAILGFLLLWLALVTFPQFRVQRLPLLATPFTFGPYLLPWLLLPISIAIAIHRHHLWAVSPPPTLTAASQ